MKLLSTVRLTVSTLAVVLLIMGYLVSQWVAMTGAYADYAQKVDSLPVRLLALVLLVTAAISCFVPDREAPP